MRIITPVFALVAMLILSACTVTGPTGATVDDTFGYNPQQYSGVNQVWIDIDADGTPDLMGTGGKEQSKIKIKGSIPLADGSLIPFEYEAEDVKAFDGQKYRADLEALIAKYNAEGNTEIADALSEAFTDLVDLALAVAAPGAGGVAGAVTGN